MLLFLTHGQEIIGVVLAALSTMVIGMLWYSPILFGTTWMNLVGMTKDMAASAKARAQKAYIVMTLSALVMAYVLGVVIKNLFAPNLFQALLIGFFVWLGFVATSMTGEYLFNVKPKPWALYILNCGYYLVSIVLNAIILFFFFTR